MRSALPGVMALAVLFPVAGCGSSDPDPGWIRAFGYTPAEVVSIEIGDYGFPYVAVTVVGTSRWLMFDTGNMVGVSLNSSLFDQLRLRSDGSWTLVDSSGKAVGSFRRADAVEVSTFGLHPRPTSVYEWEHPTLIGLVGPTFFGRGRFTLDYGSRTMALSVASAPDLVPGFREVPLVRSDRHPTLILVQGTIEGRPVLIQLDTGKSRTVIHPSLASELGLRRGVGGVSIRRLTIGNLSFRVRSAKEVDQTEIDPSLPVPILVGVGSDLLSRFVWTVDYDRGVLWVPQS